METSVTTLKSDVSSIAHQLTSITELLTKNAGTSTPGVQHTTAPQPDDFGQKLMDVDEEVLPSALLPDSAEAGDLEQVSFVGDEELGALVLPKLAEYVHQCCSKRIDKENLTDMKRRCPRPANCPTLVVPQVNEGIWKELGKWTKATDVHMQATQNLVVQGMAGVVAAKETLMQPSPSAEALTDASKLLSLAIALLGNSVFELSQRRREVMRFGINRNYMSLCDVFVPVTNQLFGDNIQDSIKEIRPHVFISMFLVTRAHTIQESGRKKEKKTVLHGLCMWGPAHSCTCT